MKICMPKQHGAWAMLIIPFWLGVAASGFVLPHIPFFIGWILLYLATYPILQLFKKKNMDYYGKWAILYFVPALLLLLFPLFYRPSIVFFGLAMIPCFILNAYYSSKKNDRALLNDISAILAFGIAGLATSYLPNGEISSMAMIAFMTSVLFFLGCTFFVKTMIREKKNITYKYISWTYHLVVLLLWAVTGSWMIVLAFIPSLIRAFYFYGKTMPMSKLGILEIVNAVIFFIFIMVEVI